MAAGGFCSGVKIIINGVWHLSLSWWLEERQLITSLLPQLMFALWLANKELPSSKLSQSVTDGFSVSGDDSLDYQPGHSVHVVN